MSAEIVSTIDRTLEKKSNLSLVIVMGIAMFVTTFDITAVITIMPRVKEDLELSQSGFAWVMDSYSLAFVTFLMAAGVVADRYGRRLGTLIGCVIFLVSSLMCAFAGGEVSLLIGRVVQGMGAAFIVCGGLAVMGHRFSGRAERAKAYGLFSTINGAAMALGPAGGGLIASYLDWHWVFLINVPICLIIIAGSLWLVDESSDSARPRIDVLGVLTLSAFLTSAVWLLMHGPHVGHTDLPLGLALVVVAMLGTAFLLSQRYGKRPLLQLGLFSSRAFIGLCVVPLGLSVAYWAVLIYLPLFLQQRFASSLSEVSFLMLAATLPMVFMPLASPRLSLALSTSAFFSLGLMVVGLGVVVIAGAAAIQNLPLALLGMTIAAVGCGTVNPQVAAKLVSLVPREQAGAVSAVTVILRQGGFALGIAMLTAVYSRLNAGEPRPDGGYPILFGIAGVSALVSTIVVWSLTQSRPGRAPA